MTTPDSFNVDKKLSQLTLKEKVTLLSLKDFWHLAPIERLGIPAIRLSDGPNGVRGTKFFRSIPSACFTCGTGLGSTWNTELLEETGRLMAQEARHKGAHVILGPTCNIQRGPLGGRGFESFSEDPILSGLSAAAIINGIQKSGILTTIKHFVCNDLEDERKAISSILSERALREVYLMPFQLATKYSNPRSFMTAYNKVNGEHASQSKKLINDILREDWGWKGLVMSDWFGCYSIEESMKAGLDLECPGPGLIRKYDSLLHQILAREIPQSVVDERIKNILQFIKEAIQSGVPGDAPEDTENNTAETSAFLRKLANEAIVLLKNDSCLLPLKKEEKVAVIGPGAKAARTFGGGSASLNPYYQTNVYDAIKNKLGTEPDYALGSSVEKNFFDFGPHVTNPNGKGFNVKVYSEPAGTPNRVVLDEFSLESSQFGLHDYVPLGDLPFYLDLEGDFVPDYTGEAAFREACLGSALVYVNDELIIDDKTTQMLNSAGNASEGATKILNVEAGETYKFRIEFGSSKTFNIKTPRIMPGINGGGVLLFGYQQHKEDDVLLNEAIETAKSADKVILCIGTSYDYESEGFDRSDMDLPGNQEELVTEILKVNKNIILVNQSGTPVTLPWIDEIPAFIQAWFNGMESGNAIADILYGDQNPSGKLPLTYPKRVEDNPAYLTFKSNNGHVIYGEDVFTGWRYYEKKKVDPLFSFGFGLSYTTFKLSDLEVKLVENILVATVKVTNTGSLAGKEVAQLYVVPPVTTTAVLRPLKELKGFIKVALEPKESKTVTIEVPYKYAASYYDCDANKWHAEAGEYGVLVGNSSNADFLTGQFTLSKAELWTGL